MMFSGDDNWVNDEFLSNFFYGKGGREDSGNGGLEGTEGVFWFLKNYSKEIGAPDDWLLLLLKELLAIEAVYLWAPNRVFLLLTG